MASIETRKNRDGKITSYRVVWRHNGAKLSQSADTMEGAKAWKRIIETAGGDPAKAENALLSKISSVPTFAEIADQHIDRLISATPYTIRAYKGYLKNHCGPISGLPVDKVDEDDMIGWIRYMQDKGKSAKTIANVHGFISAVFSTAVRKKYRPDNPCDARLLPRGGVVEDTTTFLTMGEFQQVLAHVAEEHRPLFVFLISTGLRFGEALALRRTDFQLDGPTPTARVTKSWKRSGSDHSFFIGEPKTRKAVRSVALAPSTVELVKKRLERVPEHGYVFAPNGVVPPAYDRLANNWRSAVKKARQNGLEKRPRIHDLRHSHASLMIGQGMNLYELATRLGHESITTTTGTYGHLVPDAHFRAMDFVEKSLST